LVNRILDQAIFQLDKNEQPINHSYRGCHYRWPGRIKKLEKVGLKRSISKKDCSPDNVACEGLFDLLKNGIFFHRDWNGVSVQKFIDNLNDYLICYNKKNHTITG
jgi:transposase InsO family protein